MHRRYKSVGELADAVYETKVEFNRLPGDIAGVSVASAEQGVQGQGEEKLRGWRGHGLQRRKHKQPNKKVT